MPLHKCTNVLIGDHEYYFLQGKLIGEGYFFGSSVPHPPGFSLMLGLWHKLGFTSAISHFLLLGLLGGVTAAALALLVKRLAGGTAGIIAATIAMLHPLLWINEVTYLSEFLYQLVIVLVLICAYAYHDRPGHVRAIMVGVLVAAAALVRTEALLLGPFLLMPLILRHSARLNYDCKQWPTRLRHLLITGAAVVAVVSPWVTYLNFTHDKPVIMTTSTGTTLLAGSCDSVWYGENTGMWTTCLSELELQNQYKDAFSEFERIQLDRLKDYSIRDGYYRSLAFEYISDDLNRYPVVILTRVARMFISYRTADIITSKYSREGMVFWSAIAGHLLYVLLLVPAAVGAYSLRRDEKSLVPLLAMWAVVIVTAGLVFPVLRYRVPVDITVIVLASIAFNHWLRGRENRQAVIGPVQAMHRASHG